MVEATPPVWEDTCKHCGRGFCHGEPRWIEQRRYTVHTECAQWDLWDAPPYSWKLRELRKEYRSADVERRIQIVQAGQAIRQAQRHWPSNAADHVKRVLEAVHSSS
jgi:hypothetical protein